MKQNVEPNSKLFYYSVYYVSLHSQHWLLGCLFDCNYKNLLVAAPPPELAQREEEKSGRDFTNLIKLRNEAQFTVVSQYRQF